MLLRVGDRSYDVTTRALVIGDGGDLADDDVDPGVLVTAPLRLTNPTDVCDHLVAGARQLEQTGVESDRIVVSAGAHHSAELLRATTKLAALGYPLLVDLAGWAGTDDFLGAASLAVTEGARLLRTPPAHVLQVRRVADTIAAVLEAA